MRKSEKSLPGENSLTGSSEVHLSMTVVRSLGAFQHPSSRVFSDSKSRDVPRGTMPAIYTRVSNRYLLLGIRFDIGETRSYLLGGQQCHSDGDPSTLASSQHEDFAILGKTAFLLECFDDLQVHDGCVPVGPVVDLAPCLPVAQELNGK